MKSTIAAKMIFGKTEEKMFKKLLAIMLSVTSVASFMPQIPAKAEENERYPYTLFAGSNEEGALTINSNNVCINGNIATNGTISTNAQNFNVNGSKLENVQEDTKLFFNKIDERYFAAHVDTYFEDYFLEETNINVNIPIEAAGDIGLTGNINITSGIKALNDVILSGNVENTQGSVICAETGDITINTDNVNLNGFVYAPNGCVNITAKNLNINSVIIIADTIIINCPNLNANYNAQLAEFLGNESESAVNNDDTELEVVAYGDYDTENEAFTVYWNTTIPEGTFDILISDDEENYTSIGTVKDDDSYEFTFTESFDKKYIKVVETTKSGKIYEAVPFVVICTENGYDTKVLDSDEDGLPDIYELKIGTDINKIDTDEDGLTDYQEYVYTNTDPLVYDSVIEGTSDADIDTDEDGLSNIDEFTRETYPWTPDTDNDGLSDYDEIFVYNTDPLVADSDEDGIDDGSEIKLGLDPNSPATNGIPDGEYVIPQSIETDNSILSSVNTSESPYELSIDIKTNGDAEKELTVDESGYSAVIENDAMLGASIDVEISSTCNPEEIVLKFNIKEAYTDNTLNKFSSLDEFNGIKRLNVFEFDEEQGMLLPIDTEFDVENNQLYAEVNETGTYCLMDMEIWLDNLGVEMPDNSSAANVPTRKAAPKALPYNTSKWEPTYVNAPIDIVFFIQAEDSTNYCKPYFESEKKLIDDLSLYAFSKYSDVRIYLIPYYTTHASPMLTNEHKEYSSNYIAFNSLIKSLTYKTPGNYGNRDAVSNYIQEKLSLREDADKFIFNFINSGTKGNPNEDVSAIYYANRKRINYSHITPVEDYFESNELIHNTVVSSKGLDLVIADDNYKTIKEHIEDHLSAPRPVYDIIVPTKWKKISLKGDLTPNGTTNSDTDALTDWEEVDTSKLKINSDNSIELPVFCMADLVGHLTRFNINGEYNFLINDIRQIHYLPILSDPTDEDTDDDKKKDDADATPLKKIDKCFKAVNSINQKPKVDFVEKRYDLSKKCYNIRPFDDSYLKNIVLDKALYPISFAAGNTHIIGGLISYWNDGEVQLAEMKNASKAINHYLGGSGKEYIFSSTDVWGAIVTHKANIDHYVFNMKKLTKAIEESLNPGYSMSFSTTEDCNLRATCYFSGKDDSDVKNNYDDYLNLIIPKGNTIDDYLTDSCDLIHDFTHYENNSALDWGNTIGESFVGIVCDAKCYKDPVSEILGNTQDRTIYTMTFRYYIIDIYEWAYHFDGELKVLHDLHETGNAQQYLMSGYLERTIKWEKGELESAEGKSKLLSALNYNNFLIGD